MLDFSIFIIPTIIVVIVAVGLIEKKDIYNIFCNGAVDGLKTMSKMFPSLIGIFLAVGMLRNSGLLDFMSQKLQSILNIFNFSKEIIPLMLIKPFSGSASIAFALDLMKKYGADSRIGLLSATIMSASETTFYVVAIYLSSVKIKKSSKVLIPALIADFVSMIVAVWIIK